MVALSPLEQAALPLPLALPPSLVPGPSATAQLSPPHKSPASAGHLLKRKWSANSRVASLSRLASTAVRPRPAVPSPAAPTLCCTPHSQGPTGPIPTTAAAQTMRELQVLEVQELMAANLPSDRT